MVVRDKAVGANLISQLSANDVSLCRHSRHPIEVIGDPFQAIETIRKHHMMPDRLLPMGCRGFVAAESFSKGPGRTAGIPSGAVNNEALTSNLDGSFQGAGNGL